MVDSNWITAEERVALQQAGISIRSSFPVARAAYLETPTRLNVRLGQSGLVQLGAFSYMNGGHFEDVVTGRYCSFAEETLIGLHEHPTNWLSTAPIHYRPHMDGWNDWGKSITDWTETSSRSVPWFPVKQNIIGNDVWIGRRAIIRGGVTIGDGAIIGANSVVVKDVPPYAIIGGTPAKLIRYRFSTSIIERLLQLKWWEFPSWQLSGVPFNDIGAAIDEIERRQANGSISRWSPLRRSVGEIATFLNSPRSKQDIRRFLLDAKRED